MESFVISYELYILVLPIPYRIPPRSRFDYVLNLNKPEQGVMISLPVHRMNSNKFLLPVKQQIKSFIRFVMLNKLCMIITSLFFWLRVGLKYGVREPAFLCLIFIIKPFIRILMIPKNGGKYMYRLILSKSKSL